MRSVQLSLFQGDKDFPAFLDLHLSFNPTVARTEVKLSTEATQMISIAQLKLTPEAPPFVPASARAKRSTQTPQESETAPDLSDAISAEGGDDEVLTPGNILKMIIETLVDLASDPGYSRL